MFDFPFDEQSSNGKRMFFVSFIFLNYFTKFYYHLFVWSKYSIKIPEKNWNCAVIQNICTHTQCRTRSVSWLPPWLPGCLAYSAFAGSPNSGVPPRSARSQPCPDSLAAHRSAIPRHLHSVQSFPSSALQQKKKFQTGQSGTRDNGRGSRERFCLLSILSILYLVHLLPFNPEFFLSLMHYLVFKRIVGLSTVLNFRKFQIAPFVLIVVLFFLFFNFFKRSFTSF